MLPPFIMEREDGGGWKGAGKFDCFGRCEGQMSRSRRLNPRRSHEKDCQFNGKAFADLGDTFMPDRIAGNINGVLRRVRQGQNEPDNGTAVSPGRPMPGRRAGYAQNTAVWSRQFGAFLGARPVAFPPKRFAPAGVVKTRFTLGSRARPAWSRLSK